MDVRRSPHRLRARAARAALAALACLVAVLAATLGLSRVAFAAETRHAGAPNGRLVGPDLSGLDEPALLRPGKKAALYAVAAGAADFHPEREPLILVHGIRATPGDLQAIATRVGAGTFQVYVVCYDALERRTEANGVDLAEELRLLARRLGARRDVTLVAHSLGGIVVRRALNELAFGSQAGIGSFGRVRFVAVDTPWHGYGGPSNRGAEGVIMSVVSAFMPAGLVDMRARSALFQGRPRDASRARRMALSDTSLPGNVQMELVFSKDGTQVLDHNKGALRKLAGELVASYTGRAAMSNDARLQNYWRALRSSAQFRAFDGEMRLLAARGALDVAGARAALARAFVEYPGDHVGVVKEQPGGASLVDHLVAELGAPVEPWQASP